MHERVGWGGRGVSPVEQSCIALDVAIAVSKTNSSELP
ncbi:hypothetical protein HSB1_00400 [Halogranum salarium B-1]|uniref:Uncharacterized protein n=1 Tax=Halogranum salarium B-1 TaxID=1210908 RepID=J3JHH4_9EURY|nr:hypothetical protein HSB1_00400 [Halogranum salarium B-1]